MHAKRLHNSHHEILVLYGEALTDSIVVCVSFIRGVLVSDPTPPWSEHIEANLPKILSSRLGGIHQVAGIAMIRIFIEHFRNSVGLFLDPNRLLHLDRSC
jgi:hypothetical protein